MKHLILTCLFTCLLAATAFADLYNTGVDSANIVLPGGASEMHYVLQANPDLTGSVPTVVIDNQFPFPYWMANDAVSKWIGPAPANGQTSANPADFIYTLEFWVGNVSAEITGRVASDNEVSVKLNGNGPAFLNPASSAWDYAAFNTWHDFDITSGFHTNSMNTLTFDVVNDGPQANGNPTGLRVEYTNVVGVPEPGEVTLLSSMLLGVFILKRKLTSC